MRDLLRVNRTRELTTPVSTFTPRQVRLPAVPGKALTVIGSRRSGKTPYLCQCLADRLAAGKPREALIILGLDDDRLADMQAFDLAWLSEGYFRQYPTHRGDRTVTLFLDEIQTVPGWEAFARRAIDAEQVDG